MAEPKKSDAEYVKSDVDPNLDREKMFKEAWWLAYCCCSGYAIGDIKPFLAVEAREFCVHVRASTVQFGDPFCSGAAIECCFSSQCAFPKIEGSPTCVCCNKKLAGADKVSSWKPKLFDYTFDFDKEFWLYYILCAGVAAHAPKKDGKPLFGVEAKELCCKGGAECVMPPCPDGVWCSGIGTVCCFWNQMQFPPLSADKTSTPFIACCGVKVKNKDKTEGKPAPMSYGKPAQEEMK